MECTDDADDDDDDCNYDNGDYNYDNDIYDYSNDSTEDDNCNNNQVSFGVGWAASKLKNAAGFCKSS